MHVAILDIFNVSTYISNIIILDMFNWYYHAHKC